jgi:nicotinate-nucleotide adenylyltransferase
MSSGPDATTATARRRIAIYGGAFDPPHVCHVLAATYALCSADIESLRLVPVHTHPFGKEMAPFEARCLMLEAAFAHLGPLVKVDRIEASLEGANYSIDTVEAIQRLEPNADLVWIMGADAWQTRHKWREWSRLETLFEPYILGRAGANIPDDMSVQADLPDVSSSEILRLLRQGQPVGHLLSSGVLDIIDTWELYR